MNVVVLLLGLYLLLVLVLVGCDLVLYFRKHEENYISNTEILADMSSCLPCNCDCICKSSNNSACMIGCQQQCR